MTSNVPLAPEYHGPVGEWFVRHFVKKYILEREGSLGRNIPSNDGYNLIAQARSHLEFMLGMNLKERREYLWVRGCSKAETGFLESFRSDWLDSTVRSNVSSIAQDCVSKGHGFEAILNRLPQQYETPRLRRLINDKRITQHILAITFTSCSAADLAMEAYREAINSVRISEPAPRGSGKEETGLPEIMHEASQTIPHQLKAYFTANDSPDDPDVQPPRPEDVAWINAKLGENWLDNMPIPFIFPTECGGLNIEWYIGHAEHSMEIDFANHTGIWAWWDSKSGQVHEETLNLKQNMDWQKLQKSSTGQRR